ncbi:hypothetical protein J4558_06780 [Leptolyngbya sp. 15MV]|nr:hypothetical protein J4558_06780 [Leptolyngbya sp. 15MV]
MGWWLTGAWQNTFPFAWFRPDVPIIDQFFPTWVILCAQVVPILWVASKRRHIRTDTKTDHPSGSGR